MATTRGQHLIGKEIRECVIEKLLGYGGTSAVFLAQQRTPEEKVAIKVFLPRSHLDVQMQKDFYRRFLHEAEAASKLDHPNILPIYSYGEQDGFPYIIMPYMAGGTLSEYITSHGCLSLNEAQWYLEQLASALDYAHQEHGCVHCDVKPANILLDSDGSPVLTDFGIAHIMQIESTTVSAGSTGSTASTRIAGSTGRTATKSREMLVGTPDYISPEQALGQPLDGRSDIYSLGITLFYLLVGQLPFHADSPIATALLHVHEPPPLLALLRVDITPQIDAVIQKALAKRPEARFQTAGEFSVAFAEAIQLSNQLDLDHKPPVVLDKQTKGLSRGGYQALITAKPVVSVKPAHQRTFNLIRMLIVALFLLALTVGAAVGGAAVTSRLATGTPKVQVKLAVPTHTLADNLANNQDWPTGGTFFFSGDQYHIQNKSPHNVALALYANHQYSNFHLTVTMSEIHGTQDGADYYGVAFRGAADQSHYYLFEIVGWAGGQYQFLRYDGDGHWKMLAGDRVPSLVPALAKSNTISINAKGNTFTFFVNGKRVDPPITDTSKSVLSTGEIGFSVEEEETEIVFSHLYISTSK